MEERRGEDPGRREEDRRWLKVQEQVMNLVTTQRTNQQIVSSLEIEVSKLADHVEDVDEHLRGVAGQESLDTRVAILQKEFQMHGVLLEQISRQFGGFHALLEEVKTDISTLKITKAVSEKVDGGRNERVKEWFKLWGSIIIASLALVVPLTNTIFEHWDKIKSFFHAEPQTVKSLERQIEVERRGPRGRAVRKRIAEIEKAQEGHE